MFPVRVVGGMKAKRIARAFGLVEEISSAFAFSPDGL
jgi:hypothetical protein